MTSLAQERVPGRGGVAPQDFLSPYVRRLVGVHNVDVRAVVGTGRHGRVTGADVTAHLASRATRRDVSQPEHSLRHFMSPCVRHLVDLSGVDVRSIVGTGRDGRITRADVLARIETRGHHGVETGGAPVAEGVTRPRSTAFMSMELDVTAAGGEVGEEESLAAVAAAVGRVVSGEHWQQRGLPSEWTTWLSFKRRGTQSTIDVHQHRLWSAAGLLRILGHGDSGGGDAIVAMPRSRLVIASTSHPSLIVEGMGLGERDAAVIVLGAAQRRPAVVDTAAGEVLAMRSLATLTVCFDTTLVPADGAAWLLTELVGTLDTDH